MADDNTFRLKIIAPERIFFDEDVNMVELNTSEGEIGILPKHIALTTIVAPGIMTITKEWFYRSFARFSYNSCRSL